MNAKSMNATSRKYELTCETRTVACGGGWSRILNRIRALRDIPRYGVKAGDLGGFVEAKKNLSHKGDCWIDDEACVYEDARVSGNAYVSGRSRVRGKARIYGYAIIKGGTSVFGDASVSGRVCIPVSTSIAGNAKITDDRHLMLIGSFNQNCCLTAYRGKGGGFYISRSCINAFLAGSENFMYGSKLFKILSDFDAACNNGNYRFLTEMARNDRVNWPDDEYRFMIEMLRYRARQWKQTAEPDMGAEKESSTLQGHAVSAHKYELTDETRIVDDHTLYRIRALRDIPRYGVKAGDLGGFVESEANLSHEGDCWVDDDACVYENARVSGDAHISGNIHVCGNAVIAGSVNFLDGHCVSDDAEIIEPDHVLFVGAIGPDNQHLIAYRTKGGGFCIRRSYPGLTSYSSMKIMDENHCEQPHDGDKHRFLLEMAWDTSGDWKKNEYSFMLEMIRCRIMEWKFHG